MSSTFSGEMTDLVERLRACHGLISGDPECNCAEAADEIQRLRALLREAWAVMPSCPFRERVGKALEDRK